MWYVGQHVWSLTKGSEQDVKDKLQELRITSATLKTQVKDW